MRVAYSYIRFSSKQQATGDSLRRQTEWRDRMLGKHSLKLDTSLKLNDLAVSGFRSKNITEGALAGFLIAIEKQLVKPGSVLLVESLDRLSRSDIYTCLDLFMKIVRAGVSIITRDPEREYKPGSNDPLSLIEPLLIFARANEESATKAMRLSDAWEQKRIAARASKTAMTARCPGWLVKRGDASGYDVVPVRAKAVRRCYELSAAGLGLRQIAAALNAEGQEPIGRGKASAGVWTQGTVMNVLKSRAPIGEFQPCRRDDRRRPVPDGDPIAGYYPAIVDEALWYQATRRHSQRVGTGGQASHASNLFTGVLFDARDGGRMVSRGVIRNKDGSLKYGYFASSQFINRGAGHGLHFGHRTLERAILRLLYNVRPSDLGAPPDQTQTRIAECEVRVADLEKKIESAEERAADEGDFESYLALIAKLRAKRKDEQGKLAELRAAAAPKAGRRDVQTTVEMLDALKGDELTAARRQVRAAVRDTVKEIWVLVESHPKRRCHRAAHVQAFMADGSERYAVVFNLRTVAHDWIMRLKGTDLREYRHGAKPARRQARRA